MKILKTCERCGKSITVTIENPSAELFEKMSSREAARSELTSLLRNTLYEAHPDIILAVRDETDPSKYYIQCMDRENLCYSPEAKRQHGCRSAVTNLLKNLQGDFRDPEGA